MYICICRGITENQIRRELESGSSCSFEDLQDNLEVGICCGQCKVSATEIVEEMSAENTARDNVINLWHPATNGKTREKVFA